MTSVLKALGVGEWGRARQVREPVSWGPGSARKRQLRLKETLQPESAADVGAVAALRGGSGQGR